MSTNTTELIDGYLDAFMKSDEILIKISNKEYPPRVLRNQFLERIKERKLDRITAYTFLNQLYLEKI